MAGIGFYVGRSLIEWRKTGLWPVRQTGFQPVEICVAAVYAGQASGLSSRQYLYLQCVAVARLTV